MGGYYLGLDIHKRFSQVAVMDQQGVVVEQKRVEHVDREGLREYFRQYAGSEVALEATVGWAWLADELEALGLKVHLAHPAGVPLIARSRLKDDQVDAKVLAQLLRTQFLPECYLAPPAVRERRRALRARLGLVQMRTRLKNRIHGALLSQGLFSELTDLFDKKGRAWLRTLELPPVSRKNVDRWLLLLEVINQLLGEAESDLRRWLGDNQQVKLLMTIPGIGQIIAWTLFAEIGEIERFPRPSKLAAYAGLVPYTRQSAGRLWQDRLCKQGNAFLRTAMVEAAWVAVRCDPQWRARYESLRRRMDAQSAIVVIARKLLQVAFLVLSQRRAYRPFPLRRPPRLSTLSCAPGSASRAP